MPETRTFDPAEGDDLAKLVRDAIGDGLRPTTPGPRDEPPEDVEEDTDDTPTLIDLPDLQL